MNDQQDPSTPPHAPNPGQDEPDMLSEADIAADDSALDAAHDEIARLNDRILRIAAELENTRRRADRDKADVGRYAIANFARDLVAVADNFERALRAANSDMTPDAVTSLVDGLRMTEKELLNTLERHGVRRIAAEREKFDPHLHQAVAQLPHPDIPQGHVIDVAQPGFTIGDRVLRAAMVTISSGPGGGNGGQSEQRLDTKV